MINKNASLGEPFQAKNKMKKHENTMKRLQSQNETSANLPTTLAEARDEIIRLRAALNAQSETASCPSCGARKAHQGACKACGTESRMVVTITEEPDQEPGKTAEPEAEPEADPKKKPKNPDQEPETEPKGRARLVAAIAKGIALSTK